ncbi:MAG: TMEM43 family protein [Oceanibaculum sp.]
MDKVTETTRVSLGGRLRESLIGVLIGLFLLIACPILLFWNEGRAITTAQSLEEGAAVTIPVAADPVLPANEGRLIHVSGQLRVDGNLTDRMFGVEARAVRLTRQAEMFQWIESKSSETRTKIGGGQETVTTYSYSRDWSSKPVDSSAFKEPAGHDNPPMAIRDRQIETEQARLGDFVLGTTLLRKLDNAQPLPLSKEQVNAIRAAYKGERPLHLLDDRIFIGADPLAPTVGDYRISYEIVPEGPVSIVARQNGRDLGEYQTVAGDALLLVVAGEIPASEMFAEAQADNELLSWIIRIGGILFLGVGLMMMMRPFAILADIVPLFGSLVSFGQGVIALCFGLLVGSTIIAVAWLYYRPLVAALVLAFGLATTAGIIWLAKRRKVAQTA